MLVHWGGKIHLNCAPFHGLDSQTEYRGKRGLAPITLCSLAIDACAAPAAMFFQLCWTVLLGVPPDIYVEESSKQVPCTWS